MAESILDPAAGPANGSATVWLPIPPAEIPGLPEGPAYHFWDGEEEFPADPAGLDFYVTPYMLPAEQVTRPLRAGARPAVVQTLSAGVDHLSGHLPDGSVLCNARGVHDASTAELAVALMLASLRGFQDFTRGQDAGEWRSGRYRALADRTVLIVGHGSVGSAIEERVLPFECDVLRVARSARQTARGEVHALSALPELLPRADVVVLVTPLTDTTRHLADAGFLARMKDGALLVNVGRGPVVDTGALLAEVTSGRLCAALDVTDPEPLPADHPLWRAPGVLISPHVGGNTSAFLPRAKRLLVAQLNRWTAGEPLENVMG
ncbi:2-hydroxyacid dehydrogenase [Streptomyces sp. SL13]|jgi:phosphoglycerate dehydrogenase-like enzyme|uniref:2-hydroxyacid dehydrogenase n=1 Tax=Streptantibioticus silvisoli TaxID=2705255 RepID=A0AA90K708_9ACTN|nr:2-hydroxyacid dehydrogenase [Streptantibioticus silvisoli]MDI5968413.1 2-hydroxyacid dehydrogenase [Streptantibioticus silvisoli]